MNQNVRDAWLDELIDALRLDREREADRWLREAVQLRCGAPGLLELARQDSPWRPQAWLDWLEAVATQPGPSRLLQFAREALANIPEGLESRAMAADHLAGAAQALDDRESLLSARWEAFRAEPFPRRLLDLRDAAPDRKDRCYRRNFGNRDGTVVSRWHDRLEVLGDWLRMGIWRTSADLFLGHQRR